MSWPRLTERRGRRPSSRLPWASLLWGGLGLTLLALWWWGQALVTHLVLLPAAEGRAGWMVETFDNEHLHRPPQRVAAVPADIRLELPLRNTSLAAYGLWRAPRPGVYRFYIICDDYAGLALDGREVGRQDPEQAGYNTVEYLAELKAGPHLVKLDLHNAGQRGYAALMVAGPGELEYDNLDGPKILCPRLSNIRNWWVALETSRWLWLPGLAALALAALIPLLPLAAGAGWPALAVSCLVLFLPGLLVPAPPREKAPFDDRGYLARLRASEPRYVFIGNSIVESQIDPGRLGELLGGAKVATVITHGGMTAFDYLMFKNFVLASGASPRQVFFTFRGTSLTQPRLRSEGEFRRTIESMSGEREDVLAQVLKGRRTWGRRLAGWLTDDVFTAGTHAPQVKQWLDQALIHLSMPSWLGYKPHKHGPRFKRELNQRFGLDRLRGSAGDLAEADPAGGENAANFDFAGTVEGSFLPVIIELAREKGIGLVFMRAQERPGPQGPPPQDPRMAAYLDELRAYLAARGIPFHDFTGDPELTLDLYASGDHIADPARYSEILHRRMGKVFR